ncbi:MAG TPA: hypothetical protein VEC12_11085 [Bacteroidia bacterium]|nr:hypothetical protein [Bacteroidia bacterium]
MKKIVFLLLTVFLVTSSSYAWVAVNRHRSNGGIFGYSNIAESFVKNGRNCSFNLVCSDPGWNRCRFTTYDVSNPSAYGCQAIVVNVEEENWEDIVEADINEQIANGYNTGTLIRQDIQVSHPVTFNMEDAVIIWNYTPATDMLEMIVYSYNEADSLGII